MRNEGFTKEELAIFEECDRVSELYQKRKSELFETDKGGYLLIDDIKLANLKKEMGFRTLSRES